MTISLKSGKTSTWNPYALTWMMALVPLKNFERECWCLTVQNDQLYSLKQCIPCMK
uniref:Uncharacterized protein n=1 Tax=Rhizophora mucronata TaxID=61149 RepID=A0A2P2QNV1_RHIMU